VNTEETTNDVVEWLEANKASYKRLNGYDLERLSDINIGFKNDEIEFELNSNHSLVKDVNIVWHRKWRDDDFYYLLNDNSIIHPYLRKQLGTHFASEFFAATRGLQLAFENKKWLTKPAYFRSVTSKLHTLKIAKSLGISIPNTLVTNNRNALEKFFESEKRIITKSISDMEVFHLKGESYALYTTEVSKEQISKTPKHFFPSQFQQLVDKQYEIRSFLLDGEFYSMAIFSQARNSTLVDFRHYDFENPTRQIPYKLPQELELKLKELLKILDINCGSVDLIRGLDGIYYFLEVNSNGQFGMVSLPCNYYLEEKVAKYLINEDY